VVAVAGPVSRGLARRTAPAHAGRSRGCPAPCVRHPLRHYLTPIKTEELSVPLTLGWQGHLP
jgi:hypothetical protein